ncbi:MAG: hypothetical protein ACK5N9_11035, partial [Pirellula sp.]
SLRSWRLSVNKPHCIQLLHAKAWALGSAADNVCWTRSFGGPLKLRNASQTTLCICGEWLPSRVLLNGMSVEIRGNEQGRMEAEIGLQLFDRTKVELIWDNEIGSEVTHDGFASLRSVHLEILE